jgi:hypothetical protein
VDTVSIFEKVQRKALVTRESARRIEQALVEALSRQPKEIAIDFSGIEAVTPSFVDEILTVLDELAARTQHSPLRIVFLNPPTRLSDKFAAIGRGHKVEIRESGLNAWMLIRSDLNQLPENE